MAKSQCLPGNVTVQEFAEQLGVHWQTVYSWRKKGWIDFQNGEGLDADKCLADLKNSPCPVVVGEPEETEEEVEARAEADRRKAVAAADREEMRAARERGELVRRDTIQSMLFSTTRTIRDRLLAVPARVGHRVASEADVAVCTRLIDEEITDALEELVPESLRG